MNINLLQQNFTQHYPDECDGILEASTAMVLTVAFNRRGTLLAGGCNDGKILIWDFTTKGLIKVILAHSHPVSSVNWSRDGKFLVSSGADNYIQIWHVLDGKCVYSFRSTVPILSATLCPRLYNKRLLNAAYRAPNKTVTRTRSKKSELTVAEDIPTPTQNKTLDDNLSENDRLPTQPDENVPHLLVQPLQSSPRILDVKSIVKNKDSILTNKFIIELKSAVEENDSNFVVSWNRRGDKIYVGTGRGKIFIFSWAEKKCKGKILQHAEDSDTYWTFEVKHVFKISQPAAAVRLLVFAKKTNKFLVVTDRLIRLYQEEMISESKTIGSAVKTAGELAPYQTIKDQISRQSWRVCCFSGDGEYICAGQVKQNNLSFYETAVRAENLLVKTLTTKGNDSFTDVVWHPSRPVLCCISAGEVGIYIHNYIENWSAYAPDFEELEENRLYMEKENEFDDSDEDKSASDDDKYLDEIDVDICKFDRVAAYCSSDEEQVDQDFLEYIPLTVEQIEIGQHSNLSGFLTGTGALGKEVAKKTEEITSTKPVAPSLGAANKRSKQTAKVAAKIISDAQNEQHAALATTNTNNTEKGGEEIETTHQQNEKTKDKDIKDKPTGKGDSTKKRDERANTMNDYDSDEASQLLNSANSQNLLSIELNFGSDSNLIHPLLVPSSKVRNAMKRKQERAQLALEGETRIKRSKH